jgi:hypothetical protein
MGLTLSGCGIIVGSVMTAGTGVDDLRVTQGDLATLRKGARLLIVSPFRKTETGYYLSRGDDPIQFADAMNEQKLFAADVHFIQEYGKADLVEKSLREMDGAKLAQGLRLDAPPDYLLFGTIRHRDTIVAPMRGVIMEVKYRLEFLDVATRKTVTVEVEAHDLYQDVHPGIVEELAERMSGGK